ERTTGGHASRSRNKHCQTAEWPDLHNRAVLRHGVKCRLRQRQYAEGGMRVDFLSVALRYAERGWHVFPLGANSKLPAIKGGHGVKDATTDECQIREWAKSVPHANVGLACGKPSGLFVVDIDPRNG